jgi:lycopene cyclase domain-containing protein
VNLHYTYFLVLAASLAGPLALSFDKKVGFYKKWKYLFPAMILPALLYIAWDIFFTSEGVWSFNEKYVTGVKIANLPIEEVLFFLLVPYCCVFIYECFRSYFPQMKNKREADWFLKGLAAILLILAFIFRHRYYSSWTFFLTALFIILIYTRRNFFKSFDAFSFLISYAIILLPFMLVNGLLTKIPVVVYNNAENMGIRVFTIPLEDVFYGMLLTLLNISIYEKISAKRRLSPENLPVLPMDR